MTAHTAKIFKTGSSQAVRLPKEFRLPGKEAAITHLGNAIVLQPMQANWKSIFYAMVELKDFMEEREDLPAEHREEL